MPVRLAVPEHDSVGPYKRLSASQVNAYKTCPRLWYYEKVRRFKMPQIPVLFVGRAVEDAFCRMLQESPALLMSTASSDTLANIPLDEGGVPSRGADEAWPADRLLPLPQEMWPHDLEAVRTWAQQRLEIHLPLALAAMKEEWMKDERKAGEWSTVDSQRCLDMCLKGLEMHLSEVQRCFDANGGPSLSEWRKGVRPQWPAPDGRRYEMSLRHPLAQDGHVAWVEAWEITRPWFVDPHAGKFAMNAIHPDHWFQGEYDLVYRWDGAINIVDLKASVGAGDRSGNYVEQLRMYAMLWWLTHDRKETVDKLQIWYLGADAIKDIDVPSESEMASMEVELNDLWKQLKGETPSMEDCPTNPLPMRGFAPGGVPTAAPNTNRCDRCDWKSVCPGGDGPEELPNGGSVLLPGSSASFDITPIQDLEPRMTLIADVFSIVGGGDGRRPKIKIEQNGHFAQVQLLVDRHQDGEPAWPSDLAAGDRIRLEGVVPSANYKGEIQLKVDPHAILVHVSDEDHLDATLLDFRARWNVSGRLVYRFEKKGVGRNGKSWHRKGMMLLDSAGSMKIEGWAADWGPQYDLAEIGDTLVAANISLDAWAVDVKGQINRNSKVQITERVER
jgi:hypothetical protein